MHYYQTPSGNIVEHPKKIKGEGYKEINPVSAHRYIASNYEREIMAHIARDPRLFVKIEGDRAQVFAPSISGCGRADLTICVAMIYELQTHGGTISADEAYTFVISPKSTSLLGVLLDAAKVTVALE